VAGGASGAPTLFLLTRNAQPVNEGDRANAVHAVLWGLGRTLALEHPEFWGRVVDVDESVPAGLVAKYVVAEAVGADTEDQVVYHAGLRRVPRMQYGVPFAAPGRSRRGHLRVPPGDRCDGQHRTASDPAAREDGCAHVVAVSRNPGSRLDDLTSTWRSPAPRW
jgi:phthiocerol/phenolphthiocerol synthesis type-I polyketide synthase B